MAIFLTSVPPYMYGVVDNLMLHLLLIIDAAIRLKKEDKNI